jgi:hypothetical protein
MAEVSSTVGWRCGGGLICIERLEAIDDNTSNRVSLLRLLLWVCVVPNDCFPCRVDLVDCDLPGLNAPPLSQKEDFIVAVDCPPPVIKLYEVGVAEAAALTVILVLTRGKHIVSFLVTRDMRVGEFR